MEMQLEEFDELMIGYLSENLSTDEMKSFHHLLNSDILYKQRYEELAKTHAKSFVVRFEDEKRANYQQLTEKLNINRINSPKTSFRIHLRNAAALIALIITSATTLYYIYSDISVSKQPAQSFEMEVPLGSQIKTVLPDGSIVHLNSGSTLKYDIAYAKKKTRDVYLIGEGYFEIEKDKDRPFIVHTDDINIKVLGTIFNIRAYKEDSDVEVNLLKGKINVFSTSETIGNIILSANESVIYDKRTKKMMSSKSDASQSAQWVNGKLSFVNASLVDIMKDVERKYNVQIHIKTSKMKEEVFSGNISTKFTIDEILNYVDVDKKYKWIQEGNVITITDK